MTGLEDFNETGYFVVNNWLNREECEQFLLDFSRQPEYAPGLCSPSEDILEKFKSKILDVCDLVNQVCHTNVNLIIPPMFDGTYVDSKYINWTWHLDHEPTYVFQDISEYLNFWIALRKEDAEHDGLSIIPTNVLQQKINAEQTKFVYNSRGAKNFTPNLTNKTTLVEEDISGTSMTLDLDINDIAITPSMKTGDLLVIKGDTIHRSQELKKGNRVSLTVRCINEDLLVSLSCALNNTENLKINTTDTNGRQDFYRLWNKALHTKEVQTIKEAIKTFKGFLNGN